MAKVKNFITAQKERFGDNWLELTSPEFIQRNGNRICKEIAKGKYDYESQADDFLNLKFLDNIIIYCKDQLENNTIVLNSLNIAINNGYNVSKINLLNSHYNTLCFIFSNIIGVLENVKVTNDIGYIVGLSTIIGRYSNHLNN